VRQNHPKRNPTQSPVSSPIPSLSSRPSLSLVSDVAGWPWARALLRRERGLRPWAWVPRTARPVCPAHRRHGPEEVRRRAAMGSSSTTTWSFRSPCPTAAGTPSCSCAPPRAVLSLVPVDPATHRRLLLRVVARTASGAAAERCSPTRAAADLRRALLPGAKYKVCGMFLLSSSSSCSVLSRMTTCVEKMSVMPGADELGKTG
jgi:hypothetical protein